MQYYEKKDESRRVNAANGQWSYPLLDEKNGCVNGCMTGISVYSWPQFTPPAYHEFQEGFLVISGHGEALVGTEQFPLEPDMSFVVPANFAHAMRSYDENDPLVLFWFHAAM